MRRRGRRRGESCDGWKEVCWGDSRGVGGGSNHGRRRNRPRRGDRYYFVVGRRRSIDVDAISRCFFYLATALGRFLCLFGLLLLLPQQRRLPPLLHSCHALSLLFLCPKPRRLLHFSNLPINVNNPRHLPLRLARHESREEGDHERMIANSLRRRRHRRY